MTKKEAYRILGLPSEAGIHEIKKRYRQLMLQIHPDTGAVSKDAYTYDAQAVNLAYSILVKGGFDEGKRNSRGAGGPKGEASFHGKKGHGAEKEKKAAWDAPVNANAYMEREVLHYAEDQEGAVLGSFCVAKGKYLWKPEEDFPLFLLSMFRLGKQLLDEIDSGLAREEIPALRQRIQAELTYLLAQQFMDGTALLKELAKAGTDREGRRIFYLPSMLELSGRTLRPGAGETLYPSGIRKHRLYLKDRTGRELGYLSFRDDRMYYIVIPLFEQKRVQVKIKTTERQEGSRRRPSVGYQDLHLWLRLPEGDMGGTPEDLNLQIEALLEEYRGRM